MTDHGTDRAGDFDEFVASEFTGILALAIALLRDREDALDVAQETMARSFARCDDVATMEADTLETEPWDRALWGQVATLPRRQRDAIALHYVEDLPIAEIALILDVPEGTVKSDLLRARDHLRATIERSDT